MSSHAAKHAVLLGGGSGPADGESDGEGPRRNSMCNDFLRGACSRGDACRFFHNEYGPHHGRSKAAAAAKESVCRDFLRGTCKFGDQCKYAHVEASVVASASGSASNASRVARDGKRDNGAGNSSSHGSGSSKEEKQKKMKPKHLGRKLAALTGSNAAAAQAASPATAGDASAEGALDSAAPETQAQIRKLMEQQQQLQQGKQASQAEWKLLVELKLKQTLARKAAAVQEELQKLLREEAKEQARANKGKGRDSKAMAKGEEGQGQGQGPPREKNAPAGATPVNHSAQDSSRSSAINALQTRLTRLSPQGWEQATFDSKFTQLTGKGLSTGVLLREMGVDEAGGAKAAAVGGGGNAGEGRVGSGSATAKAVSPSAVATAGSSGTAKKSKTLQSQSKKRSLQETVESELEETTADAGTAGGNRKKRRLGEGTITKEKFLKIQAKKAKKQASPRQNETSKDL